MQQANPATRTDATAPRRLRPRSLLLAGYHLAVAGLVVLTLGGFLGRLAWFFEILSHFRVQYFVLAVVLTVLCLHARRRGAALAAAACLLVNLALIAPYYQPSPPAPGGSTGRALFLNLHIDNTAYDRVRDLIRSVAPDWFVVCEVTPAWAEALDPLRQDYPHVVIQPARDSEDCSGIALFSRTPIHAGEAGHFEGTAWPSVIGTVAHGGKPITVIGTHPLPPAGRSFMRMRDAQLAAVARRAAASRDPVILLGDLNVTSWSPVFADLLHTSGLRDSRMGFGLQPSWPTTNPLWLIPIDHCLVSPEVVVQSRRIGPAVGSDHYPVIVEFTLQP
jgi:endonuclease/exonuclease/phosphatase (EEP) superfamily protein YafD